MKHTIKSSMIALYCYVFLCLIGCNNADRFSISENSVITDSKTGLRWYVGPNKDITWKQAQKWLKELTIPGIDWRLPTIEELEDFFNGDDINNIPIFQKLSSKSFWSGETKKFGGFLSAKYFYPKNNTEYLSLVTSFLDLRVMAVRPQEETSKQIIENKQK